MRIGLDARFLTHPQRGGFKRYVQGLVSGLAALAPDHEIVLYVDRPPARGAVPTRFQVHVVDGQLPVVGMPWREQVALTRAARRDRLDVFHAPCHTAPVRLAVPLVLTMHDTLWRTVRPWLPQPRRALLDRYYRVITAGAARRARVILTVSDASRRAICDLLPSRDPRSIVAVANAPWPGFRPGPDGSRSGVLALASADARKNLPALLRAYARVPVDVRRHHPLVTVWAHESLTRAARHEAVRLGIEAEVRFLQQVDDHALAALYQQTAAFVFPSTAEGFGLPVLEAMACGAPVIASRDPAVVETAGGAALLVDTDDAAAFGEALRRVLTDAACRTDLSRRGLERAARFSWVDTARVALDAYARAVSPAASTRGH